MCKGGGRGLWQVFRLRSRGETGADQLVVLRRAPRLGEILRPLTTGEDTGRKHSKPVTSYVQVPRVCPSGGGTGGCQRPQQRWSSKDHMEKWQQGIRSQLPGTQAPKCKGSGGGRWHTEVQVSRGEREPIWANE